VVPKSPVVTRNERTGSRGWRRENRAGGLLPPKTWTTRMGRRRPVFRLVLRAVTLARRHFQIKHNATTWPGSATAGGDGAIAATLTRRCDSVMTPRLARKALSA